MHFTIDVGALKPTVTALVRWGQGHSYSTFRHALLEAKDDGLGITYTTPLGTAYLSCDALVAAEGSIGVDLEVFSKFLAPYKGKGWQLQLCFEPDPKTEDRHVFTGQFFEDGCKRNRLEWPLSDGATGLFCSPDWVPDPVLASGVIQEFQVPRPRLVSLLSSGIAAHSSVEQGTSTLHSAGITVAADVVSVFSANASWGIRSELWADADLGFDTGWREEPRTVAVSAASLTRAQAIVGAFGGVEPWVVELPEAGPIRLCPKAAREDAWVTVNQADDPIALPEMLDELRAAKPSASTEKVTGSLAMNRRTFGGLRALLADLSILEAYARDGDTNWTLAFGESGLVVEVPSTLHVGGAVMVPWVSAPKGELVRIVNGSRLVALLKALTTNSEPDGTVDISFWSDGELERFYLKTHSPKGEAADAVLAPMSGEPRRVESAIEIKQTVGAIK